MRREWLSKSGASSATAEEISLVCAVDEVYLPNSASREINREGGQELSCKTVACLSKQGLPLLSTSTFWLLKSFTKLLIFGSFPLITKYILVQYDLFWPVSVEEEDDGGVENIAWQWTKFPVLN